MKNKNPLLWLIPLILLATLAVLGGMFSGGMTELFTSLAATLM